MRRNPAIIILRWGLAFVFFYAAFSSLRDPDSWVGFLPSFLLQAFDARLLLTGFSIYEFILAIWIFIGKKLAWASLLAAVTLGAITLLNLSIFIVTFRDVGLAMAALALFELARREEPGA